MMVWDVLKTIDWGPVKDSKVGRTSEDEQPMWTSDSDWQRPEIEKLPV